MAMNGKQLGSEIAAAIVDSGASADAKAAVEAIWGLIGECIVSHITKNAEIPAGIKVATSGSPTSQTGATIEAGKIA